MKITIEGEDSHRIQAIATFIAQELRHLEHLRVSEQFQMASEQRMKLEMSKEEWDETEEIKIYSRTESRS